MPVEAGQVPASGIWVPSLGKSAAASVLERRKSPRRTFILERFQPRSAAVLGDPRKPAGPADPHFLPDPNFSDR